MHDLTGYRRDCLYIIAGLDDPDGVAIQTELDAYYDGELTPGRLYANLDSLVEQGRVEKEHHDTQTNRYALTQRAEREIEDRKDWETQTLESAPEQ